MSKSRGPAVVSALVAGLWLLVPVSGAQAACENTPLVSFVNGSFEQPSVGEFYYGQFANGEMPGWQTTDSGGLEIWGNGFSPEFASDGTQFLELETNVASTASQMFATTPGEILFWSLDLMPRNQQNTFAEFTVSLSAEDSTQLTNTLIRQVDEVWATFSGTYVVPEGQTVTKFSMISDPATFGLLDSVIGKSRGENHIDNVRISAEICTADAPQTLALTGGSSTLPLLVATVAVLAGVTIARARARSYRSQ